MFCVDSMTGSVSAVPERNLKEWWDKDVSTQTSGWVLETLENLETSALNKGFFIAFNSIDSYHFLHQLSQYTHTFTFK